MFIVSDSRMNPRMLLLLAMMCLATTTAFSVNKIEAEIDEDYEDDEDYDNYEEDEDDDGYMGEVGPRNGSITDLILNVDKTAAVVSDISPTSRARYQIKCCQIDVIIIIIIIK